MRILRFTLIIFYYYFIHVGYAVLTSVAKRNLKKLPLSNDIWKQIPMDKIAYHCMNPILGNDIGHHKCKRDYCQCICHTLEEKSNDWQDYDTQRV